MMLEKIRPNAQYFRGSAPFPEVQKFPPKHNGHSKELSRSSILVSGGFKRGGAGGPWRAGVEMFSAQY